MNDKTAGILADKLLPKVTSEDHIQPVVEAFDSAFGISLFAETLKSEGDRRFNDALFKQSKENLPPPQTRPENPPSSESEEPMQQILNMMKGMSSEITSLKSERQQEGLRNQLFAKTDELKIPRALAQNITLTDAASVDTAFASLQTQHAELAKAYGTPVQTGKPNVGGYNPAQQTQNAALDSIKGFAAGRTSSGNSLPIQPEAKG